MKAFIEPLILYLVLFFHLSGGMAAPPVPIPFSASAELARVVINHIPSLALIWYLLLRVQSLKEWGIGLPKKNDLLLALIVFPALFLIGLTITLVSPHIEGIPGGPQLLPPSSIISWFILVISCCSGAYLEESFFRFYLLEKRKEMGLGPQQAVLISTLMFSICHIYAGPWAFLNAALAGLLLGFLYLRNRLLHGIAIGHALYNILVYALGKL